MPSPSDQTDGGETRATKPGEKIEKGAVTLIRRVAMRTPVQMGLHLGPVFRAQLLIQIFPQAKDYFVTFHPAPNAAFQSGH